MATETTSNKPTLYKVTPFDVGVGTVVTFAWSGRQMKSNEAIIQRVSDSGQVYDITQESFKGVHTIGTATSLANGTDYKIKIRITDMDDDVSLYSDWVTFKCLSTPTFVFSGLSSSEANEIKTSDITLNISYSQAQSEALNLWNVGLYDAQKVLLTGKEEILASQTMKHTFAGLSDMTTYFVRATGTTVNEISVDTGYYRIVVAYSDSGTFFNLEIENNEDNGSIFITSNAISITGHSDTPVTYIDTGTKKVADLQNNIVTFDEGFAISGDFVLYVKGYNLALPYGSSSTQSGSYLPAILPNKCFLTLSDSTGTQKIYFNYWKTDVVVSGTTVHRYQVFMHSLGEGYDFGLWSNYIENPAAGDMLGIRVTRVNNIYSIILLNYDE